MYCKTCGEKSFSPGNYCLHDGTFLSREKLSFKFSGKRKFCQDCGAEGNTRQNYCFSCGSAMNLVSQKQGYRVATPAAKEEASKVLPTKSIALPKLSMSQLKLALLPAFLSIVILTVLSFVVLNVSQDFINDVVFSGDSELGDVTEILEYTMLESAGEFTESSKIIGITDVMLYSNLQGSSIEWNITGDGDPVRGSIKLFHSAFLYILIPFISLFVGGMVLGRRNREYGGSLLGLNVMMAVIYAVVLAVISIFAGFSYEVTLAEEFGSTSVSMATQYSFMATLGLSFLFAFLFAGLGILFSQNYRKVSGQLSEFVPYGEGIHQAFSTVVRGIGSLFIVLSIYFLTKINEMKTSMGVFLSDTPLITLMEKSTLFVVTASAQLSTYVWNLLHFAPLTLAIKDDGEEMAIHYSTFKGVTSSHLEEMEFEFLQQMIEGSDIHFYFKIAMIIPILFFLYAGYRMARSQENLLIHVAVFSMIYAMLMTIIASITDIGFAARMTEVGYGSEEFGFSIGFGGFGLFVRSFLFALLFAYAGAWGRKRKLRSS